MTDKATKADPVTTLIDVMRDNGGDLYGGECITQLAHGLQCAKLAMDEGASDALVAAALLHDIGHLVDKKFQMGQEQEIDRRHEAIGAAYLSKFMPADVTEPIRLHVDAKRYMCATDEAYAASLSDASVRSLRLQGGPFSKAEAEAFMARPHAREAVLLRKWDDLGKDPDMVTPTLGDFRPMLSRLAGRQSAEAASAAD